MVVQDDSFNRSAINTTVVAAITSNLRLGAMPGNVQLRKGEANLARPSVVNVTQLRTIDRARLGPGGESYPGANTRSSARPRVRSRDRSCDRGLTISAGNHVAGAKGRESGTFARHWMSYEPRPRALSGGRRYVSNGDSNATLRAATVAARPSRHADDGDHGVLGRDAPHSHAAEPAPEVANRRTVKGRVLDAGGSPVAGVSVRMVSTNDGRVTETASDGTFQFDEVRPNTFRLVAEHAAGVVESAELSTEDAHPIVLVLVPAPQLSGRVRNDRGAPIGHATVRITSRSSPREHFATTDEQGAFLVPAVDSSGATLVAWARGYAARVLPVPSVEQAPRDQTGAAAQLVGIVRNPWAGQCKARHISACEGDKRRRLFRTREATSSCRPRWWAARSPQATPGSRIPSRSPFKPGRASRSASLPAEGLPE